MWLSVIFGEKIMKYQAALGWLVALVLILGLASAGAGLFWQEAGDPFSFTTLHGQTVQIAGHGLYQYDTLFTSAATRGSDVVTLCLGLPLLVVSFLFYRGGSLRGEFLLLGALAYFLYYGASLGLATAYNPLFLVYLGLFSTSFFAFVLAFSAVDQEALPARISARLPRRGMAIFVFTAGLGTAVIWLSDALSALVANRAPAALGPYTTVVTYTLDVGIIAPAALLASILLFRRRPLGYLLAGILTIMLALVGVMVVAQTAMQLSAGIRFSPGELAGKVGSWILLGGIAVWLELVFLRNLQGATERQSASVPPGGGVPPDEELSESQVDEVIVTWNLLNPP
jgi:hypothetical protein